MSETASRQASGQSPGSEQTLRSGDSSATATVAFISAQEYQAAVDLPPRSELVQGKVIEMTSPSGRHGQVCNRIAYLLTRHTEEHRCGHVLTNDSSVQTTTAPDTVWGADVAYLSYTTQRAVA